MAGGWEGFETLITSGVVTTHQVEVVVVLVGDIPLEWHRDHRPHRDGGANQHDA